MFGYLLVLVSKPLKRFIPDTLTMDFVVSSVSAGECCKILAISPVV
jgi:hypothetical protein